MNRLLGNMGFIKIYLDDILIHSKNKDEHYKHLEEVLNILKYNNVSINLEKSTFGANEVSI